MKSLGSNSCERLGIGVRATAKPRAALSCIRSRRRPVPSIDPRYCTAALRVGRSRIDHFGVFAGEMILPGRKVIEYAGERLTRAQVWDRSRKLFKRGGSKRVYIFRLNKFRYVDGAVCGSGAEYINHSCDPNLQARKARGHIFYFSRRQIQPGEELTVDYAIDAEGHRVRCRCGSPKCRGVMNRK